MTPKQKQLLEYFRDYVEQHGLSPTFSEMQVALGVASKATIARLVGALVEQGYLAKASSRSLNRNLVLSIPKDRAIPSLLSVPTAALQAELARRGAST